MTNKLSLADIHSALKEQTFSSFDDWVATAQRKLAFRDMTKAPFKYVTPPDDERAICYDTKGRRCFVGRDFMRARDEGAFPVHYIWPDQIIALAILTPIVIELNDISKEIRNAHGF